MVRTADLACIGTHFYKMQTTRKKQSPQIHILFVGIVYSGNNVFISKGVVKWKSIL